MDRAGRRAGWKALERKLRPPLLAPDPRSQNEWRRHAAWRFRGGERAALAKPAEVGRLRLCWRLEFLLGRFAAA